MKIAIHGRHSSQALLIMAVSCIFPLTLTSLLICHLLSDFSIHCDVWLICKQVIKCTYLLSKYLLCMFQIIVRFHYILFHMFFEQCRNKIKLKEYLLRVLINCTPHFYESEKCLSLHQGLNWHKSLSLALVLRHGWPTLPNCCLLTSSKKKKLWPPPPPPKKKKVWPTQWN